MVLRWLVLTALCGLALLIAADTRKPELEPRLLSIYPLTITAGQTTTAVIRGSAIQEARSIVFSSPAISATIRTAQPEPADANQKPGTPPIFALQIEIVASRDAKAGEHSLRLVTPNGLSNQLGLRVNDAPVVLEQSEAGSLKRLPAIVNGRLAVAGENDSYWVEAEGGETLTFAVVSANPAFDPSISIYEPSGSWFDSKRLNRIAFNDEPLHFPGLSSNPILVHTFEKQGRYRVQVGAFSGQGGPDYIYELRITRGAAPKPACIPSRTQIGMRGGLRAQFTQTGYRRSLRVQVLRRPLLLRNYLVPLGVDGGRSSLSVRSWNRAGAADEGRRGSFHSASHR